MISSTVFLPCMLEQTSLSCPLPERKARAHSDPTNKEEVNVFAFSREKAQFQGSNLLFMLIAQ